YADRLIVATPDLLEFVPGAEYIPNPLISDQWERLRQSVPHDHPGERPELVVAHAPTNREIKGTHYLEEAIAALQAAGVPLRLRLLEGLTQAQVRQACLDA